MQPLTVDFSALLERARQRDHRGRESDFRAVSRVGHIPGRRIDRNGHRPDHLECGHGWPGDDLPLGGADVLVTSSADSELANGNVELYSSPDATPPTITSVQLVTSRPARVSRRARLQQTDGAGDCGKYPQLSDLVAAQDDPPHRFSLWAHRGWSTATTYHSFPIAAATYDPSTSTVTLTLKRPAKASSLYEITSAYPLRRTRAHRSGGSAARSIARRPRPV